MKKLFIAVFFFTRFLGDAQSLPEITPPSPTAYQLTKYGDIPINESTGIANITVPLYNFSAGSLSLPISLSYSTSGIKVDQVASWVGMGWNLNAGGVITRTVKGVADEHAQRVFIDLNTVLYMKSNDLVPGFLNFGLDLLDDPSDYQPDIYSFNIGGFSGSFYLDQSNKPVFIKKESEIKIEKTANGFVLTSPMGVAYHFDGTGESSKSESLSGVGHQNPTQMIQTTWFLTKIRNYQGDEIYLNYNFNSNYHYSTGFDQMITATLGSGTGNIQLTTSKYKSYLLSRKISEITTNRGDQRIEFQAAKSRSDLPGEYQLNSIVLKDGNTLIKKYNLYYDDVVSAQNYHGAQNHSWLDLPEHFHRLFLKHLKETDTNGNESNGKVHSFEYEDQTALPPRMSFSQDLLGFYNGKQNMGYLPSNVDFLNMFSLNGYSTGDRSADFTYAKKGVLNKVIYPSKGYTLLEYEPAVSLETTTSAVTSNFTMQVDNLNANSVFTQNFHSLYYQKIKIYPVLSVLNQGMDDNHNKATIQLKNLTTNEVVLNQQIDRTFASSLDHWVDGNTSYEIKITLGAILDDIAVSLNFDYVSGETLSTSPVNKSGVRIRSIKNKANPYAAEEVTKYHYGPKEDLNASTLNELYAFQFIEDEGWRAVDPQGVMSNGSSAHVYTFKSSSLNHYFLTMPQSFAYNKVTISKGADFENGGIEKHFKLNNRPTNQIIWNNEIPNASYTNMAELNTGRLEKEIMFSKQNGVIDIKRNTEYIYKDVDTYIDTFLARKRFVNHGIWMNDIEQLDGVDIAAYKLYSRWSSIDSVITKEYLDNEVLTSIQKNLYTSGLAGLPNEVITTNSKGEVLKTQTWYPEDVQALSSLGSPNLISNEFLGIASLKPQHRISEPIQVKTYKDNVPLSTLRTYYKDWGDGNVLPTQVSSLKGTFNQVSNPLEERVIYHSYYPNGNIREVSKKDGTYITYIWGYDQTVPVAKIENARFSYVPAAIHTAIIDAAELDNTQGDDASEDALRLALDALRNHTNMAGAQVTTYTYDPLIGVTSVTDPRGETTHYEYDGFNRLEYVKDADGHILSANQYNYKN